MRCPAVLDTVVKIRRKERSYCKMRHKKRQNEFEPKMPTIGFIKNLRILDKCEFAHYRIGIRTSTANSYKEKTSPKIV